MSMELKGYVITKLTDGRYYAVNAVGDGFIVDDLEEVAKALDMVREAA